MGYKQVIVINKNNCVFYQKDKFRSYELTSKINDNLISRAKIKVGGDFAV